MQEDAEHGRRFDQEPGRASGVQGLPILGPESLLAAQAALAADMQGSYQTFHDRLLMDLQEFSPAAIDQLAVELKLDVARMKKDMASPDVAAKLARNQVLAEKLGVNATPTFVIGKDLAPGTLDPKALQTAIEGAGSSRDGIAQAPQYFAEIHVSLGRYDEAIRYLEQTQAIGKETESDEPVV